jgi:lycopene cyclase domain-containing protein
LLLILNIKQVSFLITFYITYTVILIPFFIANGILTGGIINRMVVVYNNNYNLGIRLFTIPVEDIFYGMLLLLLNTSLYEYIKIRFTRINNT